MNKNQALKLASLLVGLFSFALGLLLLTAYLPLLLSYVGDEYGILASNRFGTFYGSVTLVVGFICFVSSFFVQKLPYLALVMSLLTILLTYWPLFLFVFPLFAMLDRKSVV